ncbi:MAG: HipA N-terminal domain-containing protein [Chitinophagaceae bacterium]
MRQLEIYRNGIFTGILTEENRKSYSFRYDNNYFSDTRQPPVSLTLPKTQQEYHSTSLFPFFFNMLSEGVNRRLQSRSLKIDEEDHFGLLSATAQHDTIGAITVKPVSKNE